MFRCFTDSLIRPKNIASHVKMNALKFILYFLLLVVISSIPSVINVFTSSTVEEQVASSLVTTLKSNKDVELYYEIKDNQLVNNSKYDVPVSIEIENFLVDTGLFNNTLYLLFNETNQQITYSENMNVGTMVVHLQKEYYDIYVYGGEDNIIPLAHETYKDINANGLNFADLYGYSSFWLEAKIKEIVKLTFREYLFVAYLTAIPSVLFASAGSLLFEIIFLAGFVFIFFRGANLKFTELFKLITLCMTPTVMLEIFMLLPFGSIWYYGLYILGQIITIVYFYKSIRYLFMEKMKRN